MSKSAEQKIAELGQQAVEKRAAAEQRIAALRQQAEAPAAEAKSAGPASEAVPSQAEEAAAKAHLAQIQREEGIIAIADKELRLSYDATLFNATLTGNFGEVARLIGEGVSPHTVDTSGEIMKLISAEGQVQPKGWTLAHCAVHAPSHGREALLQYLSSVTAELDTPDNQDMTPIDYAAARDDADTVRILAGLEVPMHHSVLQLALEHSSTYVIKKLHDMGATLTAPIRKDHHVRPVDYAAAHGDRTMVQVLADLCMVDVKKQNAKGKTPAGYAAEHGHPNVIDLLVTSYHVDVNTAGGKDNPRLVDIAARHGQTGTVRHLMHKHKAPITALNSSSYSTIEHAAMHGHAGVIRLLAEECGVQVDAPGREGRKLIDLARESGHTAAADAIVTISHTQKMLQEGKDRELQECLAQLRDHTVSDKKLPTTRALGLARTHATLPPAEALDSPLAAFIDDLYLEQHEAGQQQRGEPLVDIPTVVVEKLLGAPVVVASVSAAAGKGKEDDSGTSEDKKSTSADEELASSAIPALPVPPTDTLGRLYTAWTGTGSTSNELEQAIATASEAIPGIKTAITACLAEIVTALPSERDPVNRAYLRLQAQFLARAGADIPAPQKGMLCGWGKKDPLEPFLTELSIIGTQSKQSRKIADVVATTKHSASTGEAKHDGSASASHAAASSSSGMASPTLLVRAGANNNGTVTPRPIGMAK